MSQDTRIGAVIWGDAIDEDLAENEIRRTVDLGGELCGILQIAPGKVRWTAAVPFSRNDPSGFIDDILTG
jgi:hypothetical protein